MINRRELLKRIAFGGITMGFANLQTFIDEASALINVNKMDKKSARTIFCIVDNPELEEALEECGREIDCDVIFDWADSPDLVFEQHFIAIVDGRYVDEFIWNWYVDLCNEGDINVPCILVGEKKYLRTPDRGKIYYFNLNTDNAIADILSVVRDIKSKLI
jgi:hypothetical protein